MLCSSATQVATWFTNAPSSIYSLPIEAVHSTENLRVSPQHALRPHAHAVLVFDCAYNHLRFFEVFSSKFPNTGATVCVRCTVLQSIHCLPSEFPACYAIFTIITCITHVVIQDACNSGSLSASLCCIIIRASVWKLRRWVCHTMKKSRQIFCVVVWIGFHVPPTNDR
jgi:hypothetical protein